MKNARKELFWLKNRNNLAPPVSRALFYRGVCAAGGKHKRRDEMAPTAQPQKIVNTRPGPGTADTEYQTEDGCWWEKNHGATSDQGWTTGEITGTLYRGVVFYD